MQRQKDSVNLMTFIKPHQSGFLLSIILAVISVTSGIVPYFAVARIVNLLIGGETNFSAYLMSTEQTPVFFAAPKYPAMLSKLAKGRTESYGDSARGPTWQSHEQRFPAALQ